MSERTNQLGGPSREELCKKMAMAHANKDFIRPLQTVQTTISFVIKKEDKNINKNNSQDIPPPVDLKHEIKVEAKEEVIIKEETDEEEEEEEEEEEIYPSPINYTYFSHQSRSCLSDHQLKAEDKKRLRNQFKDKEQLLHYLDNVDFSIIARVETSELFDVAPTFAKPMLALTVELTQKQQELLEKKFNLPADYTKNGLPLRKQPKGKLEEPKGFLESVMKNVILHKMIEDKEQREWLFRNLKIQDSTEWIQQQYDKDINPLSTYYYANLFLVDKTTFLNKDDKIPVQRMIVDARIANHFLENLAPMELFSVEALEKFFINFSFIFYAWIARSKSLYYCYYLKMR